MQVLRSLSRLLSPSSPHPALPLQPSHVVTLTKVFEAGALGQAPPTGSTGGTGGTGGGTGASDGGNLSTYKELCSLATDLGQPDLIYKFMDLAHHNQVEGGGTARLGGGGGGRKGRGGPALGEGGSACQTFPNTRRIQLIPHAHFPTLAGTQH